MSKSSVPDDSRAAATKALDSQIRRDFIRKLKDSTLPVSPPEFARDERLPLTSVSYHARRLSDLGVAQCAERIHKQGAVSSFYKLGGPNSATAVQMLTGGEGAA